MLCFDSEREQKLKAQLSQTHSAVEKEQSAITVPVKVSQHLIHSEPNDLMEVRQLKMYFTSDSLFNEQLFVTEL